MTALIIRENILTEIYHPEEHRQINRTSQFIVQTMFFEMYGTMFFEMYGQIFLKHR